jgi:hypothetical protein
MPRKYEMGELVERCKKRCDLEHDESIADAEWKALISEMYGELWSVVSETGMRYFETSTTIIANGSASYLEPESHYSTLQVTRVDASGHEVPLLELMHQEEPYVKGTTGDARYWTLVDDRLYLYPAPSSGSYKWYFIAQSTDLSDYANDQVVDVVSPHGEAFLIWGVAVKALAKSESSVQLAMAERDAARERLEYWAAQRVIGEGRRRVTPDSMDTRFRAPRWEDER